jgi:hypothetical protein
VVLWTVGIAQGRDKCRALVNAVMNLRVLYAGKLSSSYTTAGLSSSAQLLRERIS